MSNVVIEIPAKFITASDDPQLFRHRFGAWISGLSQPGVNAPFFRFHVAQSISTLMRPKGESSYATARRTVFRLKPREGFHAFDADNRELIVVLVSNYDDLDEDVFERPKLSIFANPNDGTLPTCLTATTT